MWDSLSRLQPSPEHTEAKGALAERTHSPKTAQGPPVALAPRHGAPTPAHLCMGVWCMEYLDRAEGRE